MLTNSCWQTQVDVCEQHNSILASRWREVDTNSICRQQLTNMLFVVHIHQFEFSQHKLANISLACEGRMTLSRPPCLLKKRLPLKWFFLSAVLPNATKLCYKSVFLHFK